MLLLDLEECHNVGIGGSCWVSMMAVSNLALEDDPRSRASRPRLVFQTFLTYLILISQIMVHIEKFMVCLCRVSVGFVGDSWHAVLQGRMPTLKNVRHD